MSLRLSRRWRAGVVLGLLSLTLSCERLVEREEMRIVRRFPHDTTAYTQGLVLHDGWLYESTGRYGSSQLRQIEPETGRVVRTVALPEDRFGEGLAVVGSRLVQLTWKEEVALVYDLDSMTLTEEIAYTGEGWGLCYDGETLYMSDGSATLQLRDPATFEVTGTLDVTSNGIPLTSLNELECVGDDVWANVYLTDRIVRIDKESGRVEAEVDGTPLSLAVRRPADPGAVLNGIAWDPATGRFWLTGKLWSEMLEVELVR